MWMLLWGPSNHCLIMIKDDHWLVELASGRRSRCRADKHKDQLDAIRHMCVWSSSNLDHTCLYFRHSVSAFLSFAEDSVSHCPSQETVSAFPNSLWADLIHNVWITRTLPALFTQIFAFWSKRENLTAEILIKLNLDLLWAHSSFPSSLSSCLLAFYPFFIQVLCFEWGFPVR